ncbi:hypothetical protein HOT75_gp007 [Gordonia phage Daredevil]|uniref:Uncharacterized protein n=1 Tax=Gordonia phage Daredevil TaxID=2283286 RepID=A0A345MIL4_9CAUD|nr:hypothetical protein HOT75_gp007 [Gordonia phage Daredevil]AXH70395.1 hypothetical protein SEA_DAREDEVIL_7 [Gordonia phage Daredevil]
MILPNMPPRFALLAFDLDTNELIFRAERAQFLPTEQPEREYQDIWDRQVITWCPKYTDVLLRLHGDERTGVQYTRTLTKAQVAEMKEALDGLATVD